MSSKNWKPFSQSCLSPTSNVLTACRCTLSPTATASQREVAPTGLNASADMGSPSAAMLRVCRAQNVLTLRSYTEICPSSEPACKHQMLHETCITIHNSRDGQNAGAERHQQRTARTEGLAGHRSMQPIPTEKGSKKHNSCMSGPHSLRHPSSPHVNSTSSRPAK